MADFQNVSIQSLAALQNIFCFVFEQSIMFHNVQNIYNVFYFKTSSMCIFNAVKKQSGIAFIADALFDYFVYLHSLYIVVELHTNFVLIHFGRQPLYAFLPRYINYVHKYAKLTKNASTINPMPD